MAPCRHNADPHPGFRRVVGGVNTPTRAAPAVTTTTTQLVLPRAYALALTGLQV